MLASSSNQNTGVNQPGLVRNWAASYSGFGRITDLLQQAVLVAATRGMVSQQRQTLQLASGDEGADVGKGLRCSIGVPAREPAARGASAAAPAGRPCAGGLRARPRWRYRTRAARSGAIAGGKGLGLLSYRDGRDGT